MTYGELIKKAREEEKLTQMALAEAVGVSAEAVSKWERDVYTPGPDKTPLLEKVLHLSRYDENGEPLNGRLFNEEHMSAFLKGKISSGSFPEAAKALDYAKEKHAGTFRKGPGEIPYIIHPLTMACHALALGLEDDVLLAALLLHDVPEECGILPQTLPFGEDVRKVVALVTKPPKEQYDAQQYFDAIAAEPVACLVKCIDRCNNLSTMAVGFTGAKMKKYIRETEKWYPRLLRILKAQSKWNNAAWLLEYQIKSLLLTARRIPEK